MAERIAEARKLYAAGRLFSARSRCASSCATTPAKCTNASPSRSPRCGRKRSAPKCSSPAVEFKSLLQDIDRGDVDMFRSSWVGDYNDAYTFLQYLKSDFGINLPHYKSAEYDRLLTRAAAEVDADEAARAAAAGRRRAAARSRADAALLLREQAPGEAGSARLVRQRDERRLQQGSLAHGRNPRIEAAARTFAATSPASADCVLARALDACLRPRPFVAPGRVRGRTRCTNGGYRCARTASSICRCRCRRSSSGMCSAFCSASAMPRLSYGIHLQRAGQLARRARHGRDDQHAGILRILRGDELLRDEIHAIAHRRDQRDLRRAQEAHRRRVREVAIEIADRRPVRFREAAVQAPGALLERLRGSPSTRARPRG